MKSDDTIRLGAGNNDNNHDKASFFCFSFLLLAVLVNGCHDSPAGLPVVTMKIGSRTFYLEVATTDGQREKGLMERDSLPDDQGMIFVFPEDKEVKYGFWMKNTRFPLDILYIDRAGVIVTIRQMVPYDRKTTSSDKPYRYAIELNRGAAESAGVKVGDRLTIPPQALAK